MTVGDKLHVILVSAPPSGHSIGTDTKGVCSKLTPIAGGLILSVFHQTFFSNVKLGVLTAPRCVESVRVLFDELLVESVRLHFDELLRPPAKGMLSMWLSSDAQTQMGKNDALTKYDQFGEPDDSAFPIFASARSKSVFASVLSKKSKKKKQRRC